MKFSIEDENDSDFKYLRDSAVNLFIRKELFEEAILSLESLNYHIIRLHFDNEAQFSQLLSNKLNWIDQFGYEPWNGSFDALNDGLRGEPFNTSDRSVICIEGYEKLEEFYNDRAWYFLDLIEQHSRDYLLFGKRLIGLIQTNDRDYEPPKTGMRVPVWNNNEWLISDRKN